MLIILLIVVIWDGTLAGSDSCKGAERVGGSICSLTKRLVHWLLGLDSVLEEKAVSPAGEVF